MQGNNEEQSVKFKPVHRRTLDSRTYVNLLKSKLRQHNVSDNIPGTENSGSQYRFLNETNGGSRISSISIDKLNDDAKHRECQSEAEKGVQKNACAICKLGGNLLCCNGNGCKRSYHLTCLNPPLDNFPLGTWHCIWCVKRKIERGVHSVSEEVESIWDTRELTSQCEAIRFYTSLASYDDKMVVVLVTEKQYFVKFRGLAHVHNLWMSEVDLLLKAPKLVKTFNSRSQASKWKDMWTFPCRLLQKRSLSFDEYFHGASNNAIDCSQEWLVLWTGLGYDQATWELENAWFLRTPEAEKLITDYESRHSKTENSSCLPKTYKEGKGATTVLSELPLKDPSGAYHQHLSHVNKLREHWCKDQNAIIIGDQEQIAKVVLFILSLLTYVSRPFLIITTNSRLPEWEFELLNLASSAGIVIYKGNTNIRSSIRSLEFYNKTGSIMFEMLLSTIDIVVEDLDELDCIGWEAVVIDECQCSNMLRHIQQITMLVTGIKVLLASGWVKDNLSDYRKLLSVLNSGSDDQSSNSLEISTGDNLYKMKKMLGKFMPYKCTSDDKFVEYWVPVELSKVQLEQYCAMLLSNSSTLSSGAKHGPVDTFRDILISTRKCCDHPYLLDQSLNSFVTRNVPAEQHFDIAVELSAKLELLDKILFEIKKCSLRVLIIFQSMGGSGVISVGDILDDLVCQRFGQDSFIRIDNIYSRRLKQARMKVFNENERDKFILLLECHACHPSIKISALDVVILYNSDWDPMNDLKALHRIRIASQFEQIKVLRLYSTCTVEEKILILSNEGANLDSNMHFTNRISHSLLSWGASGLFNRLDKFHESVTSDQVSVISRQQSLLKHILPELSELLPVDEEKELRNSSFIFKVGQRDGNYARHISLQGKVGPCEMNHDEQPAAFWKNLLEARNPQWKFLSGSSQRSRKRVHILDAASKENEFEDDDFMNRRKAVKKVSDLKNLGSTLKDKRHVISWSEADKETGILPMQTLESSKESCMEAEELRAEVLENVIDPSVEQRNKSGNFGDGCNGYGTEVLLETQSPAGNIPTQSVASPSRVSRILPDGATDSSSMIEMLSHSMQSNKEMPVSRLRGHGDDISPICGARSSVVQLNLLPSTGSSSPSNQLRPLTNPSAIPDTSAHPSCSGPFQMEIEKQSKDKENGYSKYGCDVLESQGRAGNIQMKSIGSPSRVSQMAPATESCIVAKMLSHSTQLNEKVLVSELRPQREDTSPIFGSSSAVVQLEVFPPTGSSSPPNQWFPTTNPSAAPDTSAQPSSSVPLHLEIEKLHKDKMLQPKSDFLREMEEVHKKYDELLKHEEEALKEEQNAFETYCNKVYLNKLLAEALMHKHNVYNAFGSGSSELETASRIVDQLIQLSDQQPMLTPSARLQEHSSGFMDDLVQQSTQELTRAPTLRPAQLSPSAAITSTPVTTPANMVNLSSAIPATCPVRRPSSAMTHFRGNFQGSNSINLRAPAPHLRSKYHHLH